jgi:hypothetical protein
VAPGVLGLDALGHHAQVEVVRELDRRAHDRGVGGVDGHLDHERLVDLDRVDRQALEVGERRVARAEVVDAERQPDLAQAHQRRLGARRVGHQHRLGDLELEQLGVDLVLGEQARDLDRELGVEERARGQVDRDRELEPGVAPLPDLREGGVEHERGQRRDQAGLLGDRDELAGPDDPELGVVPARERLGADDAARAQVGLRLVVEADLALADR